MRNRGNRRRGTTKKAVLIALAAIVIAGLPARAEIIDRIMAVVNGQPLTLSDVNAASMLQLLTPETNRPDATSAVLDRMIERTLIIGEVDRYQPPEPAPEEIEKRYNVVLQRVNGESNLQKIFADTGMTADQLRRWVRDDLRMETYFNQRFGTTDPSRARAIADWVTGLRRRADVTVLYVPPS
jgi:hypothetical protein